MAAPRAAGRAGGDGTISVLTFMRRIKIWVLAGCMGGLLAGSALAAEAAPRKLTCCEKAAAEGRECRNKCCIIAHKQGKSCEKCNPHKEDLKFLKNAPPADNAAAK